MIRFGSLTREMAEFLSACVRARLNIVVSGGTGSGKTTTLNALSSFIPEDERIITVENAAELQLRQDHVVTLESRPPNVEGKGEISIRDLVINCLRMRPERIVVGECRGGEALEMLQAMNTGHDGSMTTLHANTPRDAISRIETMVLMAGMDLPVRAIREQIAAAINVIVQQARLKDGSRKIINITEVQGMEGDVVVLQDVFLFEQTGLDERGKIVGQLRPTGIRPKFVEAFESQNIYLPPNIFGYAGERSFF
jgi:pilus assembly protein CpaF